jgi:GNAT superfamily N-acetyltransferase
MPVVNVRIYKQHASMLFLPANHVLVSCALAADWRTTGSIGSAMTTLSITKTALDSLIAKRSALSVGYDPIPQNGALYRQLLNLIASGTDEKLQSPLINAGYAVRLAAVTSTVYSFLQYHAGTPVQLVILGCGLDVMGLWAQLVDSSNVTVFELDTPQISTTKKSLLLQNKLVVDLGSDCGAVLKGHVVDPNNCGDTSHMSSSGATYNLYACDLRKIESIEPCFHTLDKSKPTLVISELVLTYLGRQGMDRLLSWCAENLCCNPTSCMAAFEALSPKAPINHSILEKYKERYCQFFMDKLSRGLAKCDPCELFCPPGCDATSVETRFRNAGFGESMAALAGNVMINQVLRSPEPFDEHAALSLHVRSYALIVGFHRRVEVPMARCLCPWSSVVKHDFPATILQGIDGKVYTIRVIQSKDQEEVRHLYSQTYEDLFEEYPSVRKMVKTGLKTDLSCSVDDSEWEYSTIGARYGLAGGVFLVAMDNRERLLGCAGLRQCQRREGQGTGTQYRTFEIHRLAVDADSRGEGVGTRLLQALETFIAKELKEDEVGALIATTPAVLIAANHLYSSSGFEHGKGETLGKMTINTYCKMMNARTRVDNIPPDNP